MEFDEDIEISGDDGTYAAELRPGWKVGGGLNGGYLLATIGRAIRASVPDTPDPIAVSAHYLGASTAGPATITTRTLRTGRSVATVAADLRQGDDLRIAVLATYGDLSALPETVETTATEPVLPPREECFSNRWAPEEQRKVAPLMDRFEMLFDPATAGWAIGQPSGEGVIAAWFRLNDEREPDPLSLLLAVDALPPVTFGLGRPGWAPTLELTAHVRALPAPGWLKLRHETRNVAGGMFEEDCEVWDSAGRLVAQSRQLARLPR